MTPVSGNSVYTAYLYNMDQFPYTASLNKSYIINSNQQTSPFYDADCSTIKIAEAEDIYAALCFSPQNNTYFLQIVPVGNELVLSTSLVLPIEDSDADFTILNSSILVTSPSSYDALFVYTYSIQEFQIIINQSLVINRDQLYVNDLDYIYSISGVTLPCMAIGVFLASGSTGFNFLYLTNATSFQLSYVPNITSYFAADYLDNYNQPPLFQSVKFTDFVYDNADSEATFNLVLSSANAFTYALSVTTDLAGNITNLTVNGGFIQYQNYIYRPAIIANPYLTILVGSNEASPGGITYFFYDIRGGSPIGTSYPVYDAMAAVPATKYDYTPSLLFSNGSGFTLFIVTGGAAGGFVRYSIGTTYKVTTDASHVSSEDLYITGGNDYWNCTADIPVYSYALFFKGVPSWAIILIVFGTIFGVFGILQWVRKCKSDKGKKLLIDTDFEGEEEGVKEYMKLGNEPQL
jgi:hypothetical protein